MKKVSFNGLVKTMKDKEVYMLIGNGTKNQFKDLRKIKGIVSAMLKDLPIGSVFLYFGDYPNKKKPDVGYLFKLIREKRPDIIINMIQIAEAESWGVPDFVNNVYWHTDYTKKCKWGGIVNNHPCSNTKKWVSVHKRCGIKKVFILGGGEITLQEFSLIKKHNIDYKYYLVERKYKGDGKTKITDNDSLKQRVGITYGKIK